MAYLEFENLDEDVKAALHNFVSGAIGGFHSRAEKHAPMLDALLGYNRFMTGANPIVSIIRTGFKLIGFKDIMDKSFFNKYWDSEKIARLVEPWCKETKNALKVSKSNTNNMVNWDFKSSFIEKSYQKKHIAAKSNSYLANPSLFKKGERSDRFTKALTCLPVKSENGFYYVYPIFDTGEIKSIKILCTRNKYNTNLYVKTLTQWNSVDQEQFKRT